MDRPPDIYTHGHHDSVLVSHRWRTAENSAAYLLAHLHPGAEVLDIGCGPGTITIDLARRLTGGRIVGMDLAPEVVAAAAAAATEAGSANAEFVVGDVYRLDAADSGFDVVHAHQVLQHLSDPVAALVEMRRVCRSGGLVAARDSDYSAMAWHPSSPGLDRWRELYLALARANDAEPDAGRHLRSWALAAGFTEVDSSASVWCYSNDAEREWWSGMWADRVTESAYATQALERGYSTVDELESIAAAWRAWARSRDGWFIVPHGEVLCRA